MATSRAGALRAPIFDSLIDNSTGMPTKLFQDWLTRINALVTNQQFVSLPGPVGQGNDDTPVLQAAINQAVNLGGATIILPSAVLSLNTVTFPSGQKPVTLLGQGASTVLGRRGDLAVGHGMLDVYGSNVSLQNLVVDGNTTVPVGLMYNGGFIGPGGQNDPMSDALTKNTAVWVHGPVSNFDCYLVTFRHSAGYAPVIDCNTGGCFDISMRFCRWENNRPNLFGYGTFEPIYGSWTGALFVTGAGRDGLVLHRLRVEGCTWVRNTGNACWSHLYSLNELHESFQIIDNSFEDQGLDGILIGGVLGGAVTGNTLRRIGYTTIDDASPSVPRWLANLNATAIDSSGLVKSVVYEGNSILSVNGGSYDLDGHGESVINGNVSRIPYPDEPEYLTDRIAISGIANNGSTSYGVNIGNTQKNIHGASNLTIVGNTLLNLPLGSIRMFAARNCLAEANTIDAPSRSVYPPIGMGPTGPDPGQRCYGNKVTGNNIQYDPKDAAGNQVAAVAIFEDDSVSGGAPYTAEESNTVYNNNPITPTGSMATEFQKSSTSGSVVYSEQVWF